MGLYSLQPKTKTLLIMNDMKKTGNPFIKTTVKLSYGRRESTTSLTLMMREQLPKFTSNKPTTCLLKTLLASTTREKRIETRSLMGLVLCFGNTKSFSETSARVSVMERAVYSLLKMEELSKSWTTKMGYSTGNKWKRTLTVNTAPLLGLTLSMIRLKRECITTNLMSIEPANKESHHAKSLLASLTSFTSRQESFGTVKMARKL